MPKPWTRTMRHLLSLSLAPTGGLHTQRNMSRGCVALAALTAASLLGGCGSSVSPSSLGLSLPIVVGDQTVVPGSALNAYSSIARGALVCWVGADGPLKASHIFHADVATPSAGGIAEIVLHQRDPTQPSPRGAKALRVTIEGDGDDSTRVTFESLKLPADLGQAMRQDAFAWAQGKQSCEAQVVRPAPSPPLATTVASGKKLKKKT
jgi:hypothetical protein